MGAIELYKILENHDWSYEYSDDMLVWDRGRASLENLKQCLQEVKENQPELKKVIKEFYDKETTEQFRKHFNGGAGYYSVLENYF